MTHARCYRDEGHREDHPEHVLQFLRARNGLVPSTIHQCACGFRWVDSNHPIHLTAEERQYVVAEAISWVEARTPYVPHAQLKGLGCDCATFILCVYRQVGLIPEIDPGNYAIDAHLHTETTEYADTILRFADEITEAEVQPGDLVLWLTAKAYAHGGIAVDFPTVIHSMMKHGVIYSNSNVDNFFQRRKRRFFRRNFSKG
jgi:cell wall-associated NlpC family hydrolase